DSPLENLPSLYEAWGTLEILHCLLRTAQQLGYRCLTQQLARPMSGGVYIQLLPGQAPAVVLEHPQTHTIATLPPQRQFRRHSQPLRSISFRQIPDITIEVRTQSASPRLYLFDPKYKLQSEEGDIGDGRPKKIDIDTMHAYRDAIRDQDGQRVVE